MSDLKIKNVDWDDIGEFLGRNPKIQTRFFKSIAKYIREEQNALEDYVRMEESLEELSAPEPLIKIFRHFKKDEAEHRNLLLLIFKMKGKL